MADKDKKTNAMRILDGLGISYTVRRYEADPEHLDGIRAAEKLGADPDTVFKTLVTRGSDREYYVFVIPVREEVDLKKAAKAAGVKSVEMIHVKELPVITGYVRGGCSPLGMKKQFPTIFDETILLADRVYVSAGRIGTQVCLEPEALIKAAAGKVCDVIRDSR